jgi:hypothetical protein
MSRGYEGRKVAWECWLHFHEVSGVRPSAFRHQCGALGQLDKRALGDTTCPGCGIGLARPEEECEPFYGVEITRTPERIWIQGLADPDPTYLEGGHRSGCRRCGETWDPTLGIHNCRAVRGGG